MRIVSGKFRHRKLQTNPGQVTRPITARVKTALFDRLQPLLAGARVADIFAGTGTIDEEGRVGPIGGIKQKMAGARSGGSDYFLAPVDNCPEVVGNVPSGLEVFAVSTFTDATNAVEGIASGRTSSLPRC